METRTATLILRYKAANGSWKRGAAARGANGRIRPGYVLIDGEPTAFDEYVYQVRYYEQRALKYETVGRNAAEAETRRRQIEQRTGAKAVARRAGLKVEETPDRKTLTASASAYIRDAEQRGATESALQARSVTEEFIRLTRRTYVDEVTRGDILHFHSALRKRRCGDRTVANKHMRLASWLRFAGADRSIIPPKPRYEEKLPTTYSSDEISSILGGADPYMSLVIGLALKCGLRDQEMVHLEWADIDFRTRVLRVRGKEKYRFRVKDSEQREVPVPASLVKELKAHRAAFPKNSLVLGTRSNQPNRKLLRLLNRRARQARLNCGRCRGCSELNRECEEWNLHKFRRTYRRQRETQDDEGLGSRGFAGLRWQSRDLV